MSALVEGPVDVALADLATIHLVLEVLVPVALLMDLGGRRVERLAYVGERRPLLELDLDPRDGLCGDLLVVRGYEGDRLAHVPDFVLRQQRLVGRNTEGGEVPVLEKGHVLPGDHRVHAGHLLGRARVQLRDPRVVVRRAERLHPQSSGNADVVDVGRAAGDVGDPVVARDACPDDFHSAPPVVIVVYLPTAVSVRSKESPRAAAATASTIFK